MLAFEFVGQLMLGRVGMVGVNQVASLKGRIFFGALAKSMRIGNKHGGKFKPLGRMHGHDLHRIGFGFELGGCTLGLVAHAVN